MTTARQNTDEHIATRLAELTEQRAAIPDDDKLSLSTTREEHEAIIEQRTTLDRGIAAIHAAVAAQSALGTAEADEQWRDFLTTARQTLCAERMTIKSPIRDKHLLGVERNLHLSIGCIDKGRQVFSDTGWALENSKLGELLRAAGSEVVGANASRNYDGQLPWHGSLPEVEQRVAKFAQRRHAAEAALNEALLDDDERAKAGRGERSLSTRLQARHCVVQRNTWRH